MVLGVVNGSMANVGGSINSANASFVGLTKYRRDYWIVRRFRADRREFVFHRLCERNVDAFEEEFNRCGKRCERFTNGWLRPLGSPVYHYAVVLDDLYINGKHVKNKNEKTYVIFDSGTTGLTKISNSLYENSAFRDGAFQAAMTFTDVKGNKRSSRHQVIHSNMHEEVFVPLFAS